MSPRTGRGGECSADQIRDQLERILASDAFAHAPVLTRLLRYVVAETNSGRASQLKEYVLGVEVFGRPASFDPRTDTIVRVQVRRLRSRLDEYYAGPGRTDPLRVEIPKGQYAVRFEATSQSGSGLRELEIRRPEHAIPSWLPAALTPLIGRELQVTEIGDLVLTGRTRLVTLTGAGGSGKTSLALEVGRNVIDRFSGVFLATLSHVSDPEMVALRLARVLGLIQTRGRDLVVALQDHVHETLHAPVLLIIDNFEHLLSAAPLLVKLLEASEFLRILVTSRAVLRIYGEQEYPVPPLPLLNPETLPPLQQVARNPAVQLFVERASAAAPGFALNADNAHAVAAICCRLDGLPLAIELAAARCRVLSPAAILDRLEKPLDLLTGRLQATPLRQQTLRNTLAWSHHLLNPGEQKLFRRLAVFAGGCTLEGAEAVCNTSQDIGPDVPDVVDSLCSKSLLQTVRVSDGEVRFTMLETIREYALEQLRQNEEEPLTRLAHAAYCVVMAEESHRFHAAEECQGLFKLFDQEHDNFRSALNWLSDTGNREWALRVANALYRFWDHREHLAEARIRLLAAVRMYEGQPPSTALAMGISRAAAAAICLGDAKSAFPEHQRALAMFQTLGDLRGVAFQLDSLGTANMVEGNLREAFACYEEGLKIYTELRLETEMAVAMSNLANALSALGDHSRARCLLYEALHVFARCGQGSGAGVALNRLADISAVTGDLSAARDLNLKAIELFRRAGDQCGVGLCLTDLGYLALGQLDTGGACNWFAEAMAAFRDRMHRRGIAKVIEGFACLAACQKQFERALALAGAGASLRAKAGAPLRAGEQSRLESQLRPARQALGLARANLLQDEGSRLTQSEAIELALEASRRQFLTGS
jgi:predicted ATPase